MIVLLDSSVLIDALRRRNPRRRTLHRLRSDGYTLATSAINVAEVYSGMRLGEEEETELLMSIVLTYVVSHEIARSAGILRRDWSRKGRTFGLADTIVAATALELNLPLFTDNHKDFPHPGLRFFPEPLSL